MPEEYKGMPMKDLRGYMTEEEVRKLIEAARSLRNKLLLRFLWVTGARISEVVGDKSWYKPQGEPRIFHGLQVKDIVWKEGVVMLDTLKRKQYPPPTRRVIIDVTTMHMLREWVEISHLKDEDRVFSISRQRVFQIVRELGKETGLLKIGAKKIHNHHFRHSHCIAYIKVNNNMEGLRKLQQKLGHANINTTAHYLQFAPQDHKEVEDIFGKW